MYVYDKQNLVQIKPFNKILRKLLYIFNNYQYISLRVAYNKITKTGSPIITFWFSIIYRIWGRAGWWYNSNLRRFRNFHSQIKTRVDFSSARMLKKTQNGWGRKLLFKRQCFDSNFGWLIEFFLIQLWYDSEHPLTPTLASGLWEYQRS